MKSVRFYSPTQLKLSFKPNLWDVGMMLALLALVVIIASTATQFNLPFHLGNPIHISLNPSVLPDYALQTLLRLLIALFFSLVFTLVFATWAAHSKRVEKIIIPCIDILQSVPVLAFLSLTIVGFIKLFPNSLLGPECASIFLIFTAQAWNMALSFYQSLKTIPRDYLEAADMLGLSAWQKFWRLEAPFATPALLWNIMMSMSASWFALVASEAISVSGEDVVLPGIGSYIALAIKEANPLAIFYAILTMFIMIILYDQLLFRPLITWAEKFKVEQTSSEKYATSWVVKIWRHTAALRTLANYFGKLTEKIINAKWLLNHNRARMSTTEDEISPLQNWLWNAAIILVLGTAIGILVRFIHLELNMSEILHALQLCCLTGLRVLASIILCTIIWVPIGVWIGFRPHFATFIQPIAQFLAAFPANLLFPLVVIVIVRYQLNVNIWTTPLMILGAQWYVLFNVIAGVTAIPKDLKQVAENFHLNRWLWWKKLILPAIFPYYLTGAITAVAGAWNTSIVAEVVSWGHTTLEAKGIGAYISHYTGNFPHTVLGVSVMCIFVFSLNHIVWRPLYRIAIQRYQLE